MPYHYGDTRTNATGAEIERAADEIEVMQNPRGFHEISLPYAALEKLAEQLESIGLLVRVQSTGVFVKSGKIQF